MVKKIVFLDPKGSGKTTLIYQLLGMEDKIQNITPTSLTASFIHEHSGEQYIFREFDGGMHIDSVRILVDKTDYFSRLSCLRFNENRRTMLQSVLLT